jgi:hypothetical protein
MSNTLRNALSRNLVLWNAAAACVLLIACYDAAPPEAEGQRDGGPGNRSLCSGLTVPDVARGYETGICPEGSTHCTVCPQVVSADGSVIVWIVYELDGNCECPDPAIAGDGGYWEG